LYRDHRAWDWIQGKLKGQTDQPNLGLASNAELLDELRTRIEVHGNLNYKTVGNEPFCFCEQQRGIK